MEPEQYRLECSWGVLGNDAHAYFFTKNVDTGKFDLTHRTKPFWCGAQEEVRIYRNCTAISVSSDSSAEHLSSVILITSEFCDKVLPTGTDLIHRFPDRYGWVIDEINKMLDSRAVTPVASMRQSCRSTLALPLTNRVYPILSVISDIDGNTPVVPMYEPEEEDEVVVPGREVPVAVAALACTASRMAEWRRLALRTIEGEGDGLGGERRGNCGIGDDSICGGGAGGSGSGSGSGNSGLCGGGPCGGGPCGGEADDWWMSDDEAVSSRVARVSHSVDYVEPLPLVRGRASVITL